MGEAKQFEAYCRACGKMYPTTRKHSETCSAACRKRVSRALKAGVFFMWGTLARSNEALPIHSPAADPPGKKRRVKQRKRK